MLVFTPGEARAYAEAGRLEEWIHAFLTTAGANVQLSVGLKRQTRWWYGPQEFPLSLLERCCGPEADMEYYQPAEDFERQVGGMTRSLQTGWQPAPLIAVYTPHGTLSVRDGSHRLEALRRIGREAYWLIIWFNVEQDKQHFLAQYQQYLPE